MRWQNASHLSTNYVPYQLDGPLVVKFSFWRTDLKRWLPVELVFREGSMFKNLWKAIEVVNAIRYWDNRGDTALFATVYRQIGEEWNR